MAVKTVVQRVRQTQQANRKLRERLEMSQEERWDEGFVAGHRLLGMGRDAR